MYKKFSFSHLSNLPEWQKTLWIVFFSQIVTVIGFASIFPFLPLYLQSLDSNTSLSIELLSGLVFASQSFTMMLASPVWGAIADRFGRKLMIERAVFGGAIVLFFMGYVETVEMLILLRLIQGFVTGSIPAANALIAATVPRERIGFAMGLMQVALWSGVAIGPLIGGVVADAFGYRASFMITAALLFVSGIMVRLGVKEEFTPPEPSKSGRPSMFQQWRNVLDAEGVKAAYFIRFLAGLGQILIFPIAPLFILTLLPADAPVNFYTGLMLSVSGITSTGSSIFLGRLGDGIGHRQILLGSVLFTALSYLPQGLVTSAWQLLLLRGMTGIGIGGTVTSLTALLAQYTKQGEEGSVYGLDAALVSGSRTIGPLLGGSLATWLGMRITMSSASLLYLLIFVIVLAYLPAREGDEKQ